MTTITIVVITLFIGIAIGYAANHFLSNSSNDAQVDKNLMQQINDRELALSQYKQDVSKHLAQSADLLVKMNNTCQMAMEQMDQSTQLLKQATPIEQTTMPFFSAETHQQLAETAAERHPKNEINQPEQIIQRPLDYSGEPSGLFVDQTQTVTNSDD